MKTGRPLQPGSAGNKKKTDETEDGFQLYRGMGIGNKSQGTKYYRLAIRYKLDGFVEDSTMEVFESAMRKWRNTNVSTNAASGTPLLSIAHAGGWIMPGVLGQNYAVQFG